MKSILSFILFLIASLIFQNLIAQESCTVKMPSISGSYKGSCKNGLASGSGESNGIDKYAGEFKKGLPHGIGTYIWSTGETYYGEWKVGLRDGEGEYHFSYTGKDSVLTGIWKNDKYIGKEKSAPYIIEYRNGIGRVTCMRVGDRPYVKYKFTRSGGEAFPIVNGLVMQGSSGNESNTSDFAGFEQVEFPFKGKITFTAPNEFNSAFINGELRLTINNPGSWIVTISF